MDHDDIVGRIEAGEIESARELLAARALEGLFIYNAPTAGEELAAEALPKRKR